jgi:hypothetical protein
LPLKNGEKTVGTHHLKMVKKWLSPANAGKMQE